MTNGLYVQWTEIKMWSVLREQKQFLFDIEKGNVVCFLTLRHHECVLICYITWRWALLSLQKIKYMEIDYIE